MNEQLVSVSTAEIGERLRCARERAGLTQLDAARILGVARTTIVAIEQGKRKPKLAEVQILANEYGTTANAIYRLEAVSVQLLPQFRSALHSPRSSSLQAAEVLHELVSAELELENALGIVRQRRYPPESPLLPGDVVSQAEHDAANFRLFLGIGNGPIIDLLGILELQLGIRLYVRPLDSKVSGLFAFDESVGACMLLNSNHPVTRIRQSGGHEVGHFAGTRRTPEIYRTDERYTSREERYASAFARALLTPAQSVKRLFSDITSGQSHLTRRHVILMAHTFGVSREALVRRLEELQLVKDRTWDWFLENGGITDDQVAEVVGKDSLNLEPTLRPNQVLPQRLSLLAREASKRGIYTEGQLSQLLSVSRHEVRAVLDGVEDELAEADDFVKISH